MLLLLYVNTLPLLSDISFQWDRRGKGPGSLGPQTSSRPVDTTVSSPRMGLLSRVFSVRSLSYTVSWGQITLRSPFRSYIYTGSQ